MVKGLLPISLAALTLVALTLFSCRKPSTANWDVDVVVPVVNCKLNVKNFLSDTLFFADNQGLLHLMLNREVASLKLDSLIALPDTIIPKTFTVPAGVVNYTLYPGEVLPPDFFKPENLKFDLDNGAELSKILVRTGMLTVKFSNNIPEPIDLIYHITSATKNGEVFTIKETVPPGKNSLAKSYDLSGYELNLVSKGSYNTIVQTYSLGLNANAKPVVVNTGDGASVEVAYSEIVADYVEGYFGQQTVEMDADTVDFGLIENFDAGNFMLSDAKMNFTLINEFGVDFKGGIWGISSINTPKKKVVPLSNDQLSRIEMIGAERTYYGFKSQQEIFPFNKSNSNITEFISNLPDKLSYQGEVTINPFGKAHGHTNFAFYNTGVRLIADIDIPIRFTADRFILHTTADTDFSNVEQLDQVNTGSFVISASNGYPFAADLQVYLMDARKVVIDSLFVPGMNRIEGGQVSAQNDVVAPTVSVVRVPMDKQRIEKLQKCKSIRTVSTLIMPPNPPDIKILESYGFDVNIIAELNYNVSINN
jgi:hypothetical protein